MASILIECVEVSFATGYQLNLPLQVGCINPAGEIRKRADKLMEYDYQKAMEVIQLDNALATNKTLQRRCNEAVYWRIILKNAELLDPTLLPSAKGPFDGCSMAEKQSAKKFMEDIGCALSSQNQRHYRFFWKTLWEMREAGVDRILLYRTKDFDSFCRSYPRKSAISLVDLMATWETQFRPYIEQLETRVARLKNGDTNRNFYLDDPLVANQLSIRATAWNNSSNQWANSTEQKLFLDHGTCPISEKRLGTVFGPEAASGFGRDKSLFIFILPGHDGSLSICSIIPLFVGDYLGVFAGEIRFSDEICSINGIQGPSKKLWLDQSRVTGVLNQMKTSSSNDPANVCLYWELSVENGHTYPQASWQASVKATANIKPLHPLVRPEGQAE